MVGHRDGWSTLSSKNIILSIVLPVEDFAPHQGSNLSVCINLLKGFPLVVIFIVETNYVEGAATLVLLPGLVHITTNDDTVFLLLVVLVHSLESFVLTVQSFFSQI